MRRGVRRGLGLLATATIVTGMASGAAAQPRPGAVVQPLAPDNGAELRGYLTTLANNPQSLDALIGAGRAALRMGDADAALTFFGRADEISPRNARVKAGMAATLVQLGQPQAALSLFNEATALGAPVVEIQGDRGLAYDMAGDPRRAQQDYVAMLRRRDDPDVRRRLALSLAISGHRDAALRTIDAQLRRNDRAAWRTQAFILALTGDAAGAGRTAQSQMPAGTAQQMAPFFARLHALGPAEKAQAVHLGRFPSNGGSRAQSAQADVAPDPAALAFVGVPARTQVATTVPSRTRNQNNERRTSRRERPDASDPYGLRTRRANRRADRLAPPVRPQQPAQREVAEVETRWAGSPYRPPAGAADPQPAASVPSPPAAAIGGAAMPPPATQAPAVTPVTIPPSNSVQPSPVVADASSAETAAAGPAAVPAGQDQSPRTSSATGLASAPQPAVAGPAASAPSLADIAALVNALPDEPPAQAASPSPPPATTRAAEPTRIASTRTAQRSTRPQTPPANPSRHWVQIAGGIDRASLPREFARLRALAPQQLGRRSAYAAPLRTTSRLLVGPFANSREAQEFVNQLARHDIEAFAWTSAAGQEIERLAAR